MIFAVGSFFSLGITPRAHPEISLKWHLILSVLCHEDDKTVETASAKNGASSGGNSKKVAYTTGPIVHLSILSKVGRNSVELWVKLIRAIL